MSDNKQEKSVVSINEKYYKISVDTEEILKIQRKTWAEKIDPLIMSLKDNFDKIYELQAYALSYRHQIGDEISFYTTKLSKVIAEQRRVKKDKFISYTMKFQIKLNTTEKNICIDADTSEMERYIELLQMHVEFLREAIKTIDNLNFGVKNKLALMEYLGNK